MESDLKKKLDAAIAIMKAVADAIKELGSVPSGHLYARLMSCMTLEEYNKIISMLKEAGVVKEENFLLTWVGK